jgi:hypothetical protein
MELVAFYRPLRLARPSAVLRRTLAPARWGDRGTVCRFDALTLYFTNVAVLFVAAVMAFLHWLRDRDQVAMAVWAVATALGGLGTLVLGLFGPLPHMDPSVVGNTVIVAGVVLGWESMRRFNGRPPAYGRIVVSIAGFLVVFGVAWWLGADQRVRVFIASLSIALFTFLASREIAFGGGNACRVAPPRR